MPIPVRIMSKRPSMISSLLSSSSFSCPTLHTVLSYHQNFAHLNVFFGIYFPTSSLFFIRSLLIQQFFKRAFSDPQIRFGPFAICSDGYALHYLLLHLTSTTCLILIHLLLKHELHEGRENICHVRHYILCTK